MGILSYLAQGEQDAKKDVDAIKPTINNNVIVLVALAGLAALAIWKVSQIFDLPHTIIIASLIALGAIIYGTLHFAHMYFNYKLMDNRQNLLLSDGSASESDIKVLGEDVDVDKKSKV